MNNDMKRLCEAAQDAKIDGQRMRFSDQYAEIIVRAVLRELQVKSGAMIDAEAKAAEPGFIWGDVIDRVLADRM